MAKAHASLFQVIMCVTVVWSDTTGGTLGKFDILVKKSIDSDGTFGAMSTTNISTNSGESIKAGNGSLWFKRASGMG